MSRNIIKYINKSHQAYTSSLQKLGYQQPKKKKTKTKTKNLQKLGQDQ